jgi:hypothetical protein
MKCSVAWLKLMPSRGVPTRRCIQNTEIQSDPRKPGQDAACNRTGYAQLRKGKKFDDLLISRSH